MSKKRVYEIARERGLETKQVLRRLHLAGVEVKAAASTVSDEDIERVFGAATTPAAPAPATTPSWLTSSASTAPKTVSRTELDAAKEARQKRADAARGAKQKAIEQAKLLRQQLAQKKAEAQAAAARAAEGEVEEPAAPVAEAVVETPISDVTVEPVVEAAPEIVEAPAGSDGDGMVAMPEAPAVEKRVGPRIISKAEPEVVVPVVSEAPAADADKGMTEADQRRRAQEVAAQRVAELAAKRRAQIEAERIETEQRAREAERAPKKKEKKGKKTETDSGTTEEFIGSRRPRVGGASRETLSDSERGSRRGPTRRRRVVIDAGASRRGGDQGGQRGRGKKGRGPGRGAAVEIDFEAPVTIHAGATVKELADALHVPATEVIKVLMAGGDFVTITVSLTAEQMELVGIGLEPPREIIVRSAADEDVIPVFDDPEESLVARAPVVTIMGHVDHGKTSLLDALRETKVAAGEAGGITQHIGAYQVEVPYENGVRRVTFLDTPGHEAFTALRARGAKVTDEAVLVVAADDGVKPQTLEAIDHARAAEVPIVVAINKIDKENAQPEKVKAELAQHDLQPIEWGGSTEVVEVSAKQRTNLDELIETILLQADVLELKANPAAEASGYIIESKLDPGRGPVCTVLVSRGTLRVGDAVVAGATWGKVRALLDFRGNRVKDAGPAMPVEIVGFDTVPDAGEFCMVVENERVARERAQKKAIRLKAELLAKRQRGLSLDDLFARIKEGEVQDLNIIVKGDVGGSIEAIEQELGKIEHPEVKVRIIHSGVGAITGNDIMLASASSAIILGFNVRPNAEAKLSAEREGVDVRTYRVIYKLREDVENALSGMLSPEEVEETLGEAEVRQVFKASRIGTIAGCMVTQGKILRNAKVRLLRSGTVVHEGEISSLKRFKEDAKEVAQGFECGIAIDGYNDIKDGDVIEAFVVKEVDRDIHS
jgi:translation initiation factor IF-2